MGAVLHRTTKEYRTTVNTPDFTDPPWLVNPNVAALQNAGVPTRYWKINPDNSVVEMTPAEKQVVDDSVQRIRLVSSAAVEFDGVPSVRANGKDVHAITVDKLNLVNAVVASGTENLQVNSDSPVAISNSRPQLAAGQAAITVGPTKQVGDVILLCKDQAGNLIEGSLTVRFRSPIGSPDSPLPPMAVFGARLTAMTGSTVSFTGRSAVRDQQNTFDIVWGGTLTADMAVSGAGGLQPGLVEAPNTWYAVLVIADTTGVNPVALMFTDNPGSPTLPAGYDVFRRIAWVRNNGTSSFIPMIQTGRGLVRRYSYDAAVGGLIALSAGNATVFTAVSLAALVPPTSRQAYVGMNLATAAAGDRARLRPTGSSVANPPLIFRPGAITAAGMTIAFEIILNASQSVDYIVDNAVDALDIGVLGFVDEL